MFDELPITLACVVFVVLSMLPRILQFKTDWERSVLYAALSAHIISAFLQSGYHHYVYRGGDAIEYVKTGTFYARILRADFFEYLPDLVSYMLQGDARLPGMPPVEPNSTTSMAALTGLVMFFAPGDLTSASVLFGGWSFFGLSCLFRVFREVLPDMPKERIAIAALGIPTVVFWSSCVTKEAFAVGGLGMLTLALHRLTRGQIGAGLAGSIVGAVSIAIVKPYVLIAFGFSTAAFIFVHRSRALDPTVQVVVRPFQFAVAFAIGIAFALGIGEISPRFAVDNLNAELSRLQDPDFVEGGSGYSLGIERDLTFAQQMTYAPLALATATLRPFIFETHNFTSFVNGLETTAILVLFVLVFMRRSVAGIGRAILQQPILAFSAVFVITFGVGVGLATSNFGTLSRYRMPLMPFWTLLLVSLTDRTSNLEGTMPAKPARVPDVSAQRA